MQDRPKISIISPSKNTGKYAKETIESIMAQSFTQWEHIVIDGGSTDDTLEVIQQYPHIRWISEEDSGPDEAFRNGLAIAKGEYVMLCCISDGYLDKNWFKKCVQILDSQPEISLVWGIDQNMLEDGTLHTIFYNSWFENPLPSGQEFIYYWLNNATLFHERDLCVRKNVIEECFPPFDRGMLGKESAFLTFMFNFNALGYLPYFLPNLAAYGRLHYDAISQKQHASNEYQICSHKYHREFQQYKRKIITGEIQQHFRDPSGNILPYEFDRRRFLKQVRKQKVKRLLTLPSRIINTMLEK